MKEIRTIETPDSQATISLIGLNTGGYLIQRIAKRAKIRNNLAQYEWIKKSGESELRPLTEEKGNEILDRIEQGMAYASCYIFYEEGAHDSTDLEITAMEHKYTSTGIKFWRHQEQMFNYRNGDPGSVISTHISPEGACNLK